MARYNTRHRPPPASAPTGGADTPDTETYQGAPGYTRDPKTELYLLAVSHMGMGAFYEHEQGRADRYRALVQRVAADDPQWLAGFLPWLRTQAGMRTAAVTGAIDTAVALRQAGVPGGRAVIASALQRADEPAEALAYYRYAYGRTLPPAVRDGIGDACRRLYTQRNALKWDSHERNAMYWFADVLRVTHPKPTSPEQATLWRYLSRQRRTGAAPVPMALATVLHHKAMRRTLLAHGAAALADTSPEELGRRIHSAGMTWEDMLSIAGETDLDPTAMWEAAAPRVGMVAAVRNLRRMDELGVSDAVAAQVCARLADPVHIRESRIQPLQLLTAYRQVRTLRWGHALEQALGHALANVPAFGGRTLVLVDRSNSMFWDSLEALRGRLRQGTRLTSYSFKPCPPDHTSLADAAAVFGGAVALRAEHADLYQFGESVAQMRFSKGDSLLRMVEAFGNAGGTDIAGAVRATYAEHDRIVIVTDEQSATGADWTDHIGQHRSYDVRGRIVTEQVVPDKVPIYTWNLAGYPAGYLPHRGNRFVFGGLSDASWRMVDQLERQGTAMWPW